LSPILPFFAWEIFNTKTFPKRGIVCCVVELFASGRDVEEGTEGEETEEVEEDFRREAEEASGGEAKVISGGLEEGEPNTVFEESGKMTKIAGGEFGVESFDVVGDFEGGKGESRFVREVNSVNL